MKAHILIAEDDINLREVIAYAIGEADYVVTQADSGTTAIELLKHANATGQPYDVVITDIVMDNGDGMSVLDTARNQPDPPEVILLTGHGSLETALAALRTAAFDYLLKPCRLNRLLERIEAAVEQRQSRQRQAAAAQAWHNISHIVSDIQARRVSLEHSHQPVVAFAPAVATTVSTTDIATEIGDEAPALFAPAAASTERYLYVGRLCIDTYRHEAWFGEQCLHLTPTEYRLLACLAAVPERVISFGDIARSIHGSAINESDAHEWLRWHVRNLRNKFDRRYLISVRGAGYMLVNPETSDRSDRA